MPDEPPFDLAEFLPYLLNQAAEASSRGFQGAYKARYGMLRTEWRVLYHLARFGEMSATELGRRAAIHKTKVSRAVRALEQKRFVARRPSPEDRRSERLALTRAGHEAFRAIAEDARAYDLALWERFAPREQAVLRRCLRSLAGAGEGRAD